jgi:KTSC domain
MNMVWDRFVSTNIRELGYDVTTRTMAVVFSDKTRTFHAPVTYPHYASIHNARFPERIYTQTVLGKIPVVSGT